MSNFFDAQETRDPQVRERDLMARLPLQVAHARRHAPWFAEAYAHIDSAAINSRSALAALPVLRKHALPALQKVRPPFGGLLARQAGDGQIARIYCSPGPIFEPEGRRPDYWRTARALYAAGFRAGDLVHNSFSYHMTPGAWMLDAGAQALGCAVFPAGVGQTEQQVEALRDLQATAYVGTPSFLRILLDKAAEMGAALALKKALVSGEAFLPPVRAALEARGIQGFQTYATADLGVIAYESSARQGLIVDEEVIVEIVRVGTDAPVDEGEIGEVVVTTFNPDYPLIRFGTGDLSAALPGPSPCGRTNLRIKGWLGRADQTAKVKGMFVHPEQIMAVVKRHPEITRARLIITNPGAIDAMTLRCVAPATPELAAAIATTLREATKLRGAVEFAAHLPDDGKLIEDARQIA